MGTKAYSVRGQWAPSGLGTGSSVTACVTRHSQVHHQTQRSQGDVSRAWPDDTRVPSDVGHLLCGLRRDQRQVRRAPTWNCCGPRSHIPCCASQGIPTGYARASMVITYLIRHGCRCNKHILYKSSLGNQDTIHGASLLVQQLANVMLLRSTYRLSRGTRSAIDTQSTPRSPYTAQKACEHFIAGSSQVFLE